MGTSAKGKGRGLSSSQGLPPGKVVLRDGASALGSGSTAAGSGAIVVENSDNVTIGLRAGDSALIQKGANARTSFEGVGSEFGNVRDLPSLYVEPDVQDVNPPEVSDSSAVDAARMPIFRMLDGFLQRKMARDDGAHCLFILGDAGMGKSSLLVMYTLRHQQQLWPGDYDCVLLKLGHDTLDRIAAVREPSRTVLLLDSLDEDPLAHESPTQAEGRLLDLLPRVASFARVVVTCRTQFFPDTSHHLRRELRFKVGPYECPLKYLSPFSDPQVRDYLRKHFPAKLLPRLLAALTGRTAEDPRVTEGLKVADMMDTLRFRPLMLSYIDDFFEPDGTVGIDFKNAYAVHNRLVEKWLAREEQKHGPTAAQGYRAAARLACHFAREGLQRMRRSDLDAYATHEPELADISKFHLASRSLLNRAIDDTEHYFQFAHQSIPEFLIARVILTGEPPLDLKKVRLSRQTLRFLADGKAALKGKKLDLRGAYPGGLDALDAGMIALRCELGLELTFGGIEFVALPPGEFVMGSPEDEQGRASSEGPQHKVRITRPFCLGRYPVTQAQYEAVTGRNPSGFKGATCPVENVSWTEAADFCRVMTERSRAEGTLPEGWVFRLPTEAEWEYACRAGTESAFNDGSECTQPEGMDLALDKLGWFAKNSGGQTHAVRQKLSNAWGLFDMHGNVWEWCLDGMREYMKKPQVDPLGSMEKDAWRSMRGGCCWVSAGFCRSAYRLALVSGSRFWNLGFRLAAGQPVEPAGG